MSFMTSSVAADGLSRHSLGSLGRGTSAASHSGAPGGGVRPMSKSRPSGKGAESIPKLYWLLGGDGDPSTRMSAWPSDEMSASTPISCWVSSAGSASIQDSSRPSDEGPESTLSLSLIGSAAKLKSSSLSGGDRALFLLA